MKEGTCEKERVERESGLCVGEVCVGKEILKILCGDVFNMDDSFNSD